MRGVIIIPNSKIFKLTLLLILLGIFHLLISLFFKTNLYFYLRNSVIVYSIFSFFIGFYSLPYLIKFVKTIKTLLWVYILYGLIFPSISILERFMAAVFFPFLFKRYNYISLTGIILLDVLLAKRYESMTVALVTFIIIIILLIQKYRTFKLFCIIGGLFIGSIFVYLSPNFKLYKSPPYNLYGNIKAVAQSNLLLQLDGNSTWRAVFWYRILIDRFPENILGIGFGTPLLEYKKGFDTVETENDDEHDIHVSGCHNTYLTLFLRMGIGFLVLIVLIFREVFKEFYSFKVYYLNNLNVLLFISFFSVSVIGLFNLVLESPTGASLFWVLLGFIAAVINNRQKEINLIAQQPHQPQ
jgi:hypothetical protein